jgi:hypothetical protein
VVYLLNSNKHQFTTGDAIEWYKKEVPTNKTHNYGNLYTLLLKPLALEGMIGRVARGVWALTLPEDDLSQHLDLDKIHSENRELQEEDDWAGHIRQKLHTSDQKRELEDD